MAKSPRWIRRALLTCGLLASLALALPTPVSTPSGGVDIARSDKSAGPGAPVALSEIGDSATPVTPSSREFDASARPARPAPAAPVISAPPGATPVRITADHPGCGAGFTAQEFLGDDPFAVCTHTYEDPAPTRSPKNGVARVAPICYGNGVNGARLQLVYMYIEGQPNRGSEWIPRITNEWVPAMEGAFRTTSAEQGREIGLRLHMPDCKIEVTTLGISAAEAKPDGGQFTRITNRVRTSGINTTDRKFHVWFDGPSAGPCGIGEALLAPVVGDNPTPTNIHNFGYDFPLVPQVAVSFRMPFPLPNWQEVAPACWGSGAMGALVESHELLHTLGAVNPSAPNSNGLGHCTDELDIMCYSEGGVETVPRCAVKVEMLDCGSDDYFNARPQLGSYLSLNWNTANSRYLGPSPEDPVPTEIPRP